MSLVSHFDSNTEAENMSFTSPAAESVNWTYNETLEKIDISLIISPINLFISAIGIAGNSLVIWFLSFKIKRSPSTIYIFNLAIADVLFLLFVSGFHVFSIVFAIWSPFKQQIKDKYLIQIFYTLIISCLCGYNTSLCLLTAISVERCISVLFPIWYRCKRPRHLSSIVCTVIWVISCLFSVLEVSFCYSLALKHLYVHNTSANVKKCNVIFVIICCVSFMIFIPSMIVSSLLLLIRMWSSSQQHQHRKLYLVIAVTVIVFLVFAMPMRILLLVWYKHHIMPPFPTTDLISLFTSLNSSINPFIYYLIGRQGSGNGKLNLLTILQTVFRDDGSQIRRQQRNNVMESIM
ncbi:proto-oncogene Mas-like [Spea bombifrons]|uniref:proto-oncogene Mas-like n=1 Tax=Spea bombifrons TaxID=233779 RepID=UPI00234AF123|nr:proto-oncogene Mas-like [Spea bombifrons]